MRRRPERLRVLLSEGASTSAREVVTALGLAGHHVEIVDPGRWSLAAFSRFTRRVHRCPPLGVDPEGFRDFILGLVRSGGFDVLLPVHEQGLLLAAIVDRLAAHVAVALPAFTSYRRAISRIGFHNLLVELDLPHPETRIAASGRELREGRDFPLYVKTEIGTASRAVWRVEEAAGLARAAEEIERKDLFGGDVLLQEVVEGPVEHAQVIFRRGRLVAAHGYRQLIRGAGGGPALKESVDRPEVRGHMARFGASLGWHGALSVDYIRREETGEPVYIDLNPRLVEPMSGHLAGVDLVEALLRVSLDEAVPQATIGRAEVRTRLAMQALMGVGLRGGRRRDLLREAWRIATGRGPWRGSQEELTPLRLDPPGAAPLLVTAGVLALSPRSASALAARGWGEHLLTPESVRRIEDWTR